MVSKIALEEHFLAPGYEEYWRPTVGNVDPKVASGILGRLTDFGETRLSAMDRRGHCALRPFDRRAGGAERA